MFKYCRSHLECYKAVIGPVLLRLPGVMSVVNKNSSIDNTYRNFRWAIVRSVERLSR